MLLRNRTPLRAATLVAAALLALVTVSPLAAQQPARPAPKRPRVDDNKNLRDERDWRAYMECGLTATSYDRAVACFYWATRLDPARPEPHYVQWLMSDLKDSTAQRRALLLDPFIYHARVLFIAQPHAGIFTTPSTRAWSALSAGNYFAATKYFGEHLARHPNDLDARWGTAIGFYYRRMFDSSVVELQALSDSIRGRQANHLTDLYESLDFIQYMQAVASMTGGDRARARSSLEGALVDNLSFYRAHILLAELDLDAGDTASAARHWGDARDLYGDDAVARRLYALFLHRTGRVADAERELRAVVASEPDWADAYADLARAVDAQGDARRADAIAAYEAYVSRAPKDPAAPREQAIARLAALRGAR